MDPLEEFILDNREELDRIEEIEEEALWQRIEGGFENKPQLTVVSKATSPWQLSIGRNWLITIAASLALCMGVGLWLIKGEDNARSEQAPFATFSSELAEEQAKYTALISQKKAEMGFDEVDRKAFQEVFQELELLEDIHGEYLNDLPAYLAKEEVIHTLTKYYERKIRILERLSREMEKHYQQEKRKNEKRI